MLYVCVVLETGRERYLPSVPFAPHKTRLKTAEERSAGALTLDTRRGEEGRGGGNSARRTGGGTTSIHARVSEQASERTFGGNTRKKEKESKERRSSHVERNT